MTKAADLANKLANIFTKALGLTSVEQGQARANLGSGLMAGHRNLFINPNFEVWQRGNSFNVPVGSKFYTADRWALYKDNAGDVMGVSRLGTLDPGDTQAGRFYGDYAMELTIGGSGGGKQLFQNIENARTVIGEVTLCFTVFADKAITISPTITRYFGPGGTTGDSASLPQVNLVAGWNEVRIKGTLPTLAGKTVNPGSYISVYLFNNVLAGGVYLAFGRVGFFRGDATKESLSDLFAPRHIQQELALCQRYFHTAGNGTNSVLDRVYNLGANPSPQNVAVYRLPVSMRALPSVSATGDINDGTPFTTWDFLSAETTDLIVLIKTAVPTMQYLDVSKIIADAEL